MRRFFENRATAPLHALFAGGLAFASFAGPALLSRDRSALLSDVLGILGATTLVAASAFAINRAVRPPLVLQIDPDSLLLRCREFDSTGLRGTVWEPYVTRRIRFTDIAKIEIGRRRDFPLNSGSSAFSQVYFVVAVREPLGKLRRFCFADLRRVKDWEAAVRDVKSHPALSASVVVQETVPFGSPL